MAGYNVDDYVQVNERIEKFYEKYPEGSIQTELIHNENGQVIFKAFAYRDREDSKPAIGHAMEKEGSSYINKTSHVENCETSAVGRALAMLGFEIKKSIASKEEVENAKLQQDDMKPVDNSKINVLQGLIKSLPEANLFYKTILETYNIKDLSQLNCKQYGEILLEIKKQKGE